jgi:hypothetical protein
MIPCRIGTFHLSQNGPVAPLGITRDQMPEPWGYEEVNSFLCHEFVRRERGKSQ